MPLSMVDLGPEELLLPPGHRRPASCHASTLVTLPGGELLAAFFAGTREGEGDTAIWLAHRRDGAWGDPRRCFAEPGLAHWNPVLHAEGTQVWLFYKVGANVQVWRTRCVESSDAGASWGAVRDLVPGDPLPRGPVKNKLLVLGSGDWLAPASVEQGQTWRAFVDRSADRGRSWQRTDVPLAPSPAAAGPRTELWKGLADAVLWESDVGRAMRWDGVIQPTLWESASGCVHMLLRSTRGFVYRSDSDDDGRSWCPAYATVLPNNNSGLDVARAADGSLLLACNPVAGNWGRRHPLSLLRSADGGATWPQRVDVETAEGEYSYPALVADGPVLHLSYTANRATIVYRRVRLADESAR